MRVRKNVLTTGEVARICHVAPRTVSKWFDAGQLRGYRIPGSRDRRIPLEHLVRFMRAHGIPLNNLHGARIRILVIDRDKTLCDAVEHALGDNRDYEVETAQYALEAGAVTQAFKPDVVVADVTLPDISAQAIVRFLRSLETATETRLIGMAQDLTGAKGQALLQEGFDGFLKKPFDVHALIRLIEDLVASKDSDEGS